VRNRIFFKLLAAFALVIAAATVTLDFSIRRAWESSLRQEIERNLRQKTAMFANRVNSDRGQHSLRDIVSQEGQAAGARATVIDVQGKVLADSEADAASMENHARRPEFVAALKGEVGTDTRHSRTVGVPFLYVAAPVAGGAVRLAYPLSDVEAAIARVRHTLLLGSLLAFVVALLVSGIAAQSTARRLRRIVQFAGSQPAIWPRASPKVHATKSDRLPRRWTRRPVTSRKALLLCRPAGASSKPCSTACRTRSSPSAPMIACNGPTRPWTNSSPSARA